MKLAAALLAAGSSSRLGRPKALLEWQGVTLVRRLAGELVAVADPVLVIAPPHAGALAREIRGTGARIVVNAWPGRGMGGSIAAAAQALAQLAPRSAALLIALVDQPLADRELFARLREAAAAGSGWAACDYANGTIGPPAIFPSTAFSELSGLTGERGARALLEQQRHRLSLVQFPGGALDIDSASDYARLAADPHLLGEE